MTRVGLDLGVRVRWQEKGGEVFPTYRSWWTWGANARVSVRLGQLTFTSVGPAKEKCLTQTRQWLRKSPNTPQTALSLLRRRKKSQVNDSVFSVPHHIHIHQSESEAHIVHVTRSPYQFLLQTSRAAAKILSRDLAFELLSFNHISISTSQKQHKKHTPSKHQSYKLHPRDNQRILRQARTPQGSIGFANQLHPRFFKSKC